MTHSTADGIRLAALKQMSKDYRNHGEACAKWYTIVAPVNDCALMTMHDAIEYIKNSPKWKKRGIRAACEECERMDNRYNRNLMLALKLNDSFNIDRTQFMTDYLDSMQDAWVHDTFIIRMSIGNFLLKQKYTRDVEPASYILAAYNVLVFACHFFDSYIRIAQEQFGVDIRKEFADGKLIETTDTFLPYYTKDAIGRKQNKLDNENLGDRSERWMIGVSTMSGCPVHCKFCATGNMKQHWRNLSADEIVEQVKFAIDNAGCNPLDAKEFKINYTRMGEPFLNIEAVKEAIKRISEKYPNTHHYVSTIGIKGSDFSFVEDNVTLQISLHSFDEKHRDWLIPLKKKMSIEELGQIRTKSNLKTTINLTLIDESDFDGDKLRKYFDPEYFFVKLSPINPNEVSEKNGCGKGVVEGVNLV